MFPHSPLSRFSNYAVWKTLNWAPFTTANQPEQPATTLRPYDAPYPPAPPAEIPAPEPPEKPQEVKLPPGKPILYAE